MITNVETIKQLLEFRQSIYSEINPVRATMYYCVDCALTEGERIEGDLHSVDIQAFFLVYNRADARCPHISELVGDIFEK